MANAGPCIEACREAQVREIFFTMWGDDGAYCDHDSAFAGMAWCADKAYGVESPGGESLNKRFAAVCGGDYEAHLRAAELHGGVVENFHPAMWADPLFENPWRRFNGDDTKRMAQHAAAYDVLATDLARHRDPHVHGAGDMRLAAATARAVADRYALIAALLDAYKRQDKDALKKAVAGIAPTRESIRAMAGAFRTMWLNHNKREGLETIQARFGMLDARYQEMQQCVQELLDGTINEIAEWEA